MKLLLECDDIKSELYCRFLFLGASHYHREGRIFGTPLSENNKNKGDFTLKLKNFYKCLLTGTRVRDYRSRARATGALAPQKFANTLKTIQKLPCSWLLAGLAPPPKKRLSPLNL